MFNMFITFVATLVGGTILFFWCKKIFLSLRNAYYERKERKENEAKLDKTELETLNFEERLFTQYKQSCFELLKKQMQASKIIDGINKLVVDYKNQAKKCKSLYNKTNDEKYKKNAYFFLQEIDNSEKIIALAETTIKDCKDKIDSAEIEYKTILSKIRTKQFEYKLLGNTNSSNELIDKSEYESILAEYTNKIDVKKIDAKVDEAIEKQKALSASSETFFKLDELEKTYAAKFNEI